MKEEKTAYIIAMAAGRDAANKQMKEAGRTSWSQEDYNRAAEIFHAMMSGNESTYH